MATKSLDKSSRSGNAGGRNTRMTPGVTQLLRAWSDGDEAALNQLAPLVEPELRRLARAHMARERTGHTLQATALVNEVFLRFKQAPSLRWQDRSHFIGIAARVMRRVLVDHARARGYAKRGGGAQQVVLHEAMLVDARAGSRFTGAGSRAGGTRESRCSEDPCRRAAVFRRLERGRDGSGSGCVGGNHQA